MYKQLKNFLYKKKKQYERSQFLKARKKEDTYIHSSCSGYWKVSFEGKNRVPERCHFLSDEIKIGFATTLGVNNWFGGKVQIGNYCQIGADVAFHASNHPISYMTTYINANLFGGSLKNQNDNHTITIGHDVWIGHGVIIVGKVKVGNGAIIAAGSVVTKEVAPFTIVGGVPAKLIRRRFKDTVIHEIEQLQWWFASEDELERLKPLFFRDFDNLDTIY
jgi:virginiamycin A acetyltransferase